MIPDFLKRENQKKREPTNFDKAIQRYVEHFGVNDLSTEPISRTEEEWIVIIEQCIAQNKSFWELFGDSYDPECDY